MEAIGLAEAYDWNLAHTEPRQEHPELLRLQGNRERAWSMGQPTEGSAPWRVRAGWGRGSWVHHGVWAEEGHVLQAFMVTLTQDCALVRANANQHGYMYDVQ